LDFPWLGKCGVLFLLDYIFTLDFPWLDLSRDYLLRTVRLPLHHPLHQFRIVKAMQLTRWLGRNLGRSALPLSGQDK
jgi:hypothetical protein